MEENRPTVAGQKRPFQECIERDAARKTKVRTSPERLFAKRPPGAKLVAPIQMSLGTQKKLEAPQIKKPHHSVATVFNESSEECKEGDATQRKKPCNSDGLFAKGKTGTKVAPIKMSLGTQKKLEAPQIKKPHHSVASVFNESSESEEEEMPLEARMRMKNVGKFTPTAAGPNSFGKGNMGFVDRRALMKKELEDEWKKTKEEDEQYIKTHKINMKFT